MPDPANDEATTQRLSVLDDADLASLDAWWRANNYLTVGQIYLQDNPLLREPLTAEHIKPRLLGHWGTSPGLSFIYAHVSRLIRHTGQQMIYLAGPGHGGPALVAAGYLEGTYSEIYPEVSQDEAGHAAAVPAVLQPGRHPQPRVGDHARLDPRGRRAGLRAGARVRRGDGQPRPARARGGRRRRGRDRPAGGLLEGHLVPQPGPRRRGAADPAPQRRQDRRPDRARPQGPGRGPVAASRATATRSSRSRATTCPACTTGSPTALARGVGDGSGAIQAAARGGDWDGTRPRWPMIVLRTPEGLDRPGRGRRHPGDRHLALAPGAAVRRPGQPGAPARSSSTWLRSYRPEELFDDDGAPTDAGPAANPAGDLRMSATPHANGGLLTARPRPARLPRLRGRRARARRSRAPSRPASSAR